MKIIILLLFLGTTIPVFAQGTTSNDVASPINNQTNQDNLKELENRISDIEIKADYAVTQSESVQDQNLDLNKRVENIQEKYDNIEEKFNSIQIRIEDMKINVENIKTNNKDLGTKIDTLLLDHNVTKINDTATNIVSVGLSLSAIILSGVVFFIQYKQGRQLGLVIDDTRDLTTKVHTVTTYLDKRLKGREKYTAFVLNSKLDLVIRELIHQLGLYEKWKIETNEIKKDNFFNGLKNSYDRCFPWINLGITPLELRDIFEDDVAEIIQTTTNRLSIHSSVYFLDYSYDDETTSAFIDHIKECRELCEKVKIKLMSIISSVVKEK